MINKDDKIEKIPLFSKGCLTFKDSGHTLIKDGEYYRCSLNVKRDCTNKTERLINAKNFEKKFARLMDKFMLPDGYAHTIFDKLIGTYIQGMVSGASRDIYIQEILESTGNLMIADLQDGKEIKKSDFLEFQRTYFKIIKNFYADLLPAFIIDFLFVLINNKKEQNEMNKFLENFIKQKPRKLHHNFALQLKKIYISNEGEIKNIEFEGYGWFIFQYFKKLIPEYQPNLKNGFIINTKKFKSFEFPQALNEFLENDLKDTYSYNAFATKYAKEKIIDKIFGGFDKLTTEEKINYLIRLNSPTKEMVFTHFLTLVRN